MHVNSLKLVLYLTKIELSKPGFGQMHIHVYMYNYMPSAVRGLMDHLPL